ncbi:MAG TPA: ABC transporter permease [Lacisediminihabitans sp.]|uniref:ABC transporter permease n=1 Tax=Lacisediminihabitans sp. TaxID=2787631 RepID=UPI002EDB3A5E
MARYLLTRVISSAIAVLIVVTLVFFSLNLAGDPVRLLVDPAAPQSVVDQFRHNLGYDRPLWVQYFIFLKEAVTLRFPDSLLYHQPSVAVVFARIPATVELAVTALVLALAVGLPLGYLAAQGRNAFTRTVTSWPVGLLQAFPSYYLGIVLALVFGVGLRILPTGGSGDLRHLILPAVALALVLMPTVSRVFRQSIGQVAGQDFARTALAKGIGRRQVVLRHIVPNALLPVVTIVGLELGTLLGGSIILEQVFSWQGIGQLAIGSILNRDYPVVLALVTVLSIIFVALNLLVDLLYGFIDPRIRLTGGRR